MTLCKGSYEAEAEAEKEVERNAQDDKAPYFDDDDLGYSNDDATPF